MDLQISPDKMELYKQGARDRLAREKRELLARHQSAWAAARKAAHALKERFGAKRVIAFGSLAREHGFHADSDIDLAVEGIPAGDFVHTWAQLDHLDIEFEIDLIALERAPARLLKAIEQGVEL